KLEQLKALAEANKWDPALELTRVLATDEHYRGEEDQKRISKPLADLLAATLRSGIESTDGNRVALQRIHDLDELFPGKNFLQPVSAGLHRQAEDLFKEAKKLADAKQEDLARETMNRALRAWPNNPEMRKYQEGLLKLHQVLNVGVRSLPEFMSPSRAVT